MDMSDELRRFKFLLISGILFLVSAVFSYEELRYCLWSDTCDAQLVRASETRTTGRRGRTREKLTVEYQFADRSGANRRESDIVARDWPLERSPDNTIKVQFIPGAPGSSRLDGHTEMVWVYIFLASTVAVGGFFVQFWRFYKS